MAAGGPAAGGRYRTDCVERPLSRSLRRLGGQVGAQPWPFLLFPVAVSAALGVGFVHLPNRQSNDIVAQFTPRWSPAKADRRLVQERFPSRDSQRFSAQRLTTEGAFASFVAVVKEPNQTLLTPAAFAELLALDRAMWRLNASGPTYLEVCARSRNSCASPNPLLGAVGDNPAYIETLLPGLTFPLWRRQVFLGASLGGVAVDAQPPSEKSRPVLAAKAMRLFYYLQEDDAAQREASVKWLKAFLVQIPDVLASLNLTSVQVAYLTSISQQEEFEKSGKAAIPLFSITYFLTIFFSVISCARLDCVQTKVWVGVFGVLSSGLAVLSSFGLLMSCEVPFPITVANALFLILGVAIVDMSIMVSCWQKTKVKDEVKDRMADTYAEAAVSVTITTLTGILAFYVASATSFPSIQLFCIYTGTAFIFCYIYNLTFLGAILTLNGRREESNRHWLTCMKVSTETQESRGSAYNMCCVGGSYNESTGAEFEHPMNGFFRKHFGPFLMHPCTKVFVVVLYLGYLGSSIYGCTRVKEGIDLRHLVNDHSHVIKYYNWTDNYFKDYGPKVMVIVTESLPYWNSSVRSDLENCMQFIENSTYVNEYLSESWLRTHITIAKTMYLAIDDPVSFIQNFVTLFQMNPEFELDINFTDQAVLASRFFIQTVNVLTAVDERMLLEQLRGRAAGCKIPLRVYHPAFIYFDQYLVIAQNTIQNAVIGSGAMLLISLLLIPNPLCLLWVPFAIGSIIVGVTGFMAFWGVNLDSISMINLIICIGFSVVFSAHISYAFVSSEKPGMNDRAVDALYHLGYPVVQGAVSTILGVLVLSMASAYIFRTFFKIMFLVILFGALHGLIFIPVFLTFFGLLGRL
ncbi:patched domain-containing protein 3-like [Sphaerodactylus townsendi]|uniref:patched domain-containing protein 3-like n=1 Tax=Sphaerodactylus townsendi TaxID=933632 RepID=UPI0020262EF9|nr:patched domain-containing protein 3-like [Sphaerodactylus townsendi]